MATYYEWHFIILLYLFRQREGRVGAVPIENLCCASVLSDSRAIRRSESLASARRNEERERVFYRYCPCSPLFMSEQSPQIYKLHQYMHEVTNNHYDKLNFLFSFEGFFHLAEKALLLRVDLAAAKLSKFL